MRSSTSSTRHVVVGATIEEQINTAQFMARWDIEPTAQCHLLHNVGCIDKALSITPVQESFTIDCTLMHKFEITFDRQSYNRFLVRKLMAPGGDSIDSDSDIGEKKKGDRELCGLLNSQYAARGGGGHNKACGGGAADQIGNDVVCAIKSYFNKKIGDGRLQRYKSTNIINTAQCMIAASVSAIQPSSTKLGDLRRFGFNSTKPSLTSVEGMAARIAVSSSAVSIVLCKSDESSSLHVSRRTGNYHPNLWDDHLIQSLPTPAYEHEANSELARETLIREIKGMFGTLMGEGDNDLLDHLLIVDDVERMGIDRHFEKEIKVAVEYVYRYWNESRGIGRGRKSAVIDLNTTALGLRILRLHRYHVSPDDVLQNFRDENGHFNCCHGSEAKGDGDEIIRSMLNLFRASLVAFEGEKVMDEAKFFTVNVLKQVAAKRDDQVSVSRSILQEAKYALDYPWRNSLPRLEARNFIDAYAGQSTATSLGIFPINSSNEYRLKCLELAKLDFNMLQSSHQKEMQLVSRWWRQSGLADLTFARHRHVEFSFWAAAMAPEPGFSKFRIAFAKLCTLVTIIDDIHDTYGTVDELILSQRQWDLSLMDRLPEYMRICFKVLYEVVNELATEAKNTRGHEYVPTMEEYIDNGIISFGLGLVTLHGMLLWNQPLTDHILREIDMPSRFHRLVGLTALLRGDCQGFRIEKARGEVASSVSCYMKDNPGCKEEDALKYIDAVVDDLFKGLNWELFKPDNINNDSMWNIKKHAFNIARGTQFFYTHRDGFKDSATDINDHVRKALIEPVPII
eukprot:Gb_19685 [translate_table: standard]